MARKRAHKEGSVFQDKNGVWWAQLPPDEHGRRPKRRAKTQREALQKLAELERERAQGVNLSMKQPTVGQFLQLWLAQLIKPDTAPGTYANYAQVVRLYIEPSIGHIRLDKLTAAHVQAFKNALREKGLAPNTQRNAFARLSAALEVAVKWNYVSKNVARLADPPESEDQEVHPLTQEQAKALLAAVAGHRLEALYWLTLSLGPRKGEVLGLRWADLNWSKKELKIAGQVQMLNGKTTRSTRTKTRSSVRTLLLSDELITILQEHWDNQQRERRFLGVGWKEHGLIFPSDVGTPMSPRNLIRHFKKVLEDAKLPLTVRFHDLRHTAASLMLANGVPLITVSKILGHSSPAITARIYAHAYDDDKARAVEGMARVLRRQPKDEDVAQES